MEKRNVLQAYLTKVEKLFDETKNIMEELRFLLSEKNRENERLKKELKEALHLSNLCQFTGVFHKMAIEERGKVLLDLFKRNLSKPLAGVYLDIDNFKQVNDTYGHDAGDRVIQTLVEKIQECVRETDMVGRVGGDEFLLLLPGSDEEGGMKVAEKITEMLASTPIPLGTDDGKEITVTISMGVIEATHEMQNLQDFLNTLDKHMFENKRSKK